MIYDEIYIQIPGTMTMKVMVKGTEMYGEGETELCNDTGNR